MAAKKKSSPKKTAAKKKAAKADGRYPETRYPETKILSRNFDVADAWTLAVARKRGAYKSLDKALTEMTPAQVIEEVKTSRVRGRGGAGFPTGAKWGFVPKESDKPKYLVLNADESEPGTFKDRWLMELDPHLVLEGCLLCAYACGLSTIYIYVRGEYPLCIERLWAAIHEAREAGILGAKVMGHEFACEAYVHPGAGAYICGEETGMLESLEGKRGHPRIKPPFPAVQGAFGCPTVINNVETLAHVPWIIEHGGEAFAAQGIQPDPDNPRALGSSGTKLMGVSGPVKNPGLWEFEFGITVRELIYDYAGGPLDGRTIKAVIPGGLSMPVLRDDELDVPMGFDALVKAGSGLGTGTSIVMDDTCDMVEACENIAHFFADESCGQCTPCREGCHWMEKIFKRILGGEGTPADIDLLERLFVNIEGRTICALADAAVWPLRSIVRKFRHEFLAKMPGYEDAAAADAEAVGELMSSSSKAEVSTVFINGQEYPFEPGQTVIQVAHAHGIDVPNYCYHPGLSIAGNCRICMIEVEGNPQPQISCKLACAPPPWIKEPLRVQTESEIARDGRKGVMEMLLVNHPLDCPICDQAGECHLQDYSYEHGGGVASTSTAKTRLPKNVPFGEKIVYDAERCIKCTLCVRFTQEISETHELDLAGRGDEEIVIMTSKGEFETPYAMNIIDICPVGALTSKDFRFKSRLWFMDFTPSLCTGCARGCNVTTGGREAAFLRMEPRENQDVNQWWMCDAGRLDYEFVNSPTRLVMPMVRGADGALAEVNWEDALTAAANALRSDGGDVLLDGNCSLEEMALGQALASALAGTARFAARVGDDGDDHLIVNEKGANAKGAEALGIERQTEAAPAAVLVVERDGNVPAALRDASGAVVVFVSDAAHIPESAQVAFPFGTWAERDGLLMNIDGRVQAMSANAAIGPNNLTQPVEVLEDLIGELDDDYDWQGRDGVVAALTARLPGVDIPEIAEAPAVEVGA